MRQSPYPDLEHILGRDEIEDPFHFGRSLLEQIRSYPGQEVGTHTFSHYFCLEPTQDLAVFRADLEAAFRGGGEDRCQTRVRHFSSQPI